MNSFSKLAPQALFCLKYKNLLVHRHYYNVSLSGLDRQARCKKCGYKTEIIL